MTQLYTLDILRLASAVPHLGTLDAPDGHAERRSPVCGSRIAVDVRLGAVGEVSAFAQRVNACALGQASAALLGAHITGRTLAEVEAARDALAAYLTGARDDPGDWPGLDLFAAARPHSARHASIRLPFEATAAAIAAALHRSRDAA